MKEARDKPTSPEEILAAAEAWFHRQCEVLAKCHGSQWPMHRTWVEELLRAELRQRLIARGWRSKE